MTSLILPPRIEDHRILMETMQRQLDHYHDIARLIGVPPAGSEAIRLIERRLKVIRYDWETRDTIYRRRLTLCAFDEHVKNQPPSWTPNRQHDWTPAETAEREPLSRRRCRTCNDVVISFIDFDCYVLADDPHDTPLWIPPDTYPLFTPCRPPPTRSTLPTSIR